MNEWLYFELYRISVSLAKQTIIILQVRKTRSFDSDLFSLCPATNAKPVRLRLARAAPTDQAPSSSTVSLSYISCHTLHTSSKPLYVSKELSLLTFTYLTYLTSSLPSLPSLPLKSSKMSDTPLPSPYRPNHRNHLIRPPCWHTCSPSPSPSLPPPRITHSAAPPGGRAALQQRQKGRPALRSPVVRLLLLPGVHAALPPRSRGLGYILAGALTVGGSRPVHHLVHAQDEQEAVGRGAKRRHRSGKNEEVVEVGSGGRGDGP